MKTIAVINHKGGVGKTTSVANIGAWFAKKGYKTLLVDLDSQYNLTQHFGFKQVNKSIYDAFADRQNGQLPVIEINDNLYLVPSSRSFEMMNTELVNRAKREEVLNKLLIPFQELFDYCIIDCPPSLGVITQNAIVAAKEAILPIQAEYFSFTGVQSIVSAFLEAKKELETDIRIIAVFMTRYDKRKGISKAIKKEIENNFSDLYISTPVRENVAAVEASSKGTDIFSYAPGSHAAHDYQRISDEILKKLNHG